MRWFTGVRRTLLLAFLPFAVLLLVFAVKVFVMLASNDAGRDAYAGARYDESVVDFERNRNGDVLEDWVASYNRGTAMHRLGRYAEARADLERALQRVPKQRECMVRLNLALTLEAQGDELRSQQRAAEAQQLYAQARTVLRDGGCGELPDKTASPSASSSPSQSKSASPSNASSGTPSKSDSGKPSTATSGKPSTATSGKPTDGPSGPPTTGSGSGSPTQDPTSEQERKEQEQQRSKEADDRLSEKEEQAQKEAEQQKRNESRAATASPSKSASGSRDPQAQQSQLDQKNKEGQQGQQDRKDSGDRTASGGPTATAEKRW